MSLDTNSLQYSVAATYSASVVDCAIIGCFLEHQLIGPPAKHIIQGDSKQSRCPCKDVFLTKF